MNKEYLGKVLVFYKSKSGKGREYYDFVDNLNDVKDITKRFKVTELYKITNERQGKDSNYLVLKEYLYFNNSRSSKRDLPLWAKKDPLSHCTFSFGRPIIPPKLLIDKDIEKQTRGRGIRTTNFASGVGYVKINR